MQNMLRNIPFLKQIFEFEGVKKMLSASDFGFPLSVWQSTSNVLATILIASFIINILSLAFPMALLQVYDRVIPNVAINTLVLLVIGVVSALTLEALLKIARSYVSAWADAKFEHKTGCEAFARIIRSSLKDFEREGSGIHLKRLNAINQMRDFYSGQALVSIADMPFILVLLFLIGYIGGWVVLVPIVMLVGFLLATILNARGLEGMLESRQTHDDRRFNFIIETLGNIHTVKSVTMEAQMMRRYERLQKTASVHDHDIFLKGSVSAALGLTISQLTIVLVVAFGSLMVINGDLTVGGLAACTLLSGRCLQPVSLVVGIWTRLKTITIARDDVEAMLKMPSETAWDAPDIKKIEGGIEFVNVSFRYHEDAPWVFKNVNLKLDAKQTVAISGAGLSGKSTLLWLIMGILQPTEGKILIDGDDASKYNLQSLRQQVGYLPQKSVLFSGTIMENITMFEDEEYEETAKRVCNAIGLAEEINKLPKGYDTQVADQAIESLPRGINQRIAIARGLLREPPIVLFDEANTAIDMRGDAVLKNLLTKMADKCTLVLISHRPSILEVAKNRYVIENYNLKQVHDG